MNTMGADRATGHMREEILADKGMGVIVVSSLLLMAVTAVKEEKLVNIKAVEVLYFQLKGWSRVRYPTHTHALDHSLA